MSKYRLFLPSKTSNFVVLLFFMIALSFSCKEKKKKDHLAQQTLKEAINRPTFVYQNVTGIGKDSIYNRRDNSDVIKVGDFYYVYYTRMNSPITPGYPGRIWYATSKDEGYTWQEQAMALDVGEGGTFDSYGVFTPNILAYGGKYYLYYTAVQPTPGNPDKAFEGNHTTDFTAIGLAVADSPDGPFERVPNNPVIVPSEVSSDFDSYRVDDASLMVRAGEIWLYYKGRCLDHGKQGPRLTEMGLAYANHPEGPFIKHGQALLDESHEVLIWGKDGGIASLASISHSINYAKDGINFSVLNDSLVNIPKAPGLYRPHLEQGNTTKPIPGWGIAMKSARGLTYLIRYEIKGSS